MRRASASTTRWPTLCRVLRYSGPGLPSPTTAWATYFFFSPPAFSASPASSLGLRSVSTSGSAAAASVGAAVTAATSSAAGGATGTTAWFGSVRARTPSGGHRHHRLVRIVQDAHPVGDLQVLDGEDVVDVQVGDVGFEVLRNAAGQAGDPHFAEHHLENALRVLDPDRLAHVVDGHRDLDGAVHRHFLQVDVDEVLRDRIELHVPDDRHLGVRAPLEAHPEELGAALVAVDE